MSKTKEHLMQLSLELGFEGNITEEFLEIINQMKQATGEKPLYVSNAHKRRLAAQMGKYNKTVKK